jgi:hypothetical protein
VDVGLVLCNILDQILYSDDRKDDNRNDLRAEKNLYL